MASSKQGFQTGREVGGESCRKREERVRREWERWRVKERRNANGWKAEKSGLRERKQSSLLSDKAACILAFSGLKQFFHVLPFLLAFLFIFLSHPAHLLPSEESLLCPHPPSQFLSLFLFPLIFFLLWIIYCSRGEWKCVYFECVCALNRMLNDCRWERDCINPIYVETF